MKHIFILYIILFIYVKDCLTDFLECSANSDCIAEDATCQNNICECPQGQVFSLDGLTCLPIAIGIKAQCTDDQQCAWLLGKYRCFRSMCECEEGWRYYQGRCVRTASLSQPCNTDQDCLSQYDLLAMTCIEGTCSCNTGYYLRGSYDCRPAITELGDYCSLDSDCKMNGAACIGSFCTNSAYSQKSTNYSSHEENVLPSRAVNVAAYDTPCNTDSDCTTTNSMCYPLTKTCICKRGYFLKSESDGCVAELGVDVGCTRDEDCKITPGRCISGKCYCRKTYFTASSNDACQKPMTQDNLFCNNAERCYVMGTDAICQLNECMCRTNAELDEDYVCRSTGGVIPEDCNDNPDLCNSLVNSICISGKCICPENFREENNVCLPNLGASCDNVNKPCTIYNSVCSSNGVCVCQQNYTQNGANTCVQISTSLGDACEINEQCSEAIKFSECRNNVCECMSEYVSQGGSCYAEKYMGDICTTEKECHIILGTGVQCRNGICQCSADAIPTENRKDCMSGSDSLRNSAIMTLIILYILHLHLLT